MLFSASKTQFLHLSTRHNFPNNYPLFLYDTQLSPSPTLNILGLSFISNLNWKLHISSLAKTASIELGDLCRLRQLLTSQTANSIQVPYPSMYGVCFTCLGKFHSYSSIEQVKSKAFRLINSSPLTNYLQPLSHRRNVASLALFYRYFHANSLTACLPCSRGLAAQDLLLPLTPILSTSLMQDLTSILSLSSLSLVNSGTLSLFLHFHLTMT